MQPLFLLLIISGEIKMVSKSHICLYFTSILLLKLGCQYFTECCLDVTIFLPESGMGAENILNITH